MRFRRVPEGSGGFQCRYLGEVPEGSGADAEVKFHKIPVQSVGHGQKVPVQIPRSSPERFRYRG